MRGRTVHCIANKITPFQSLDYLHCLVKNDADNLYFKDTQPHCTNKFHRKQRNSQHAYYKTSNVVKCDEIYRQKPVDKQNYGSSQKLILYICTQTINIYHYGAEKDRTYYLASDCFRNNRHHWCFSPPDRTTLWLGRVQQLPHFCGMLHCHWSNLS